MKKIIIDPRSTFQYSSYYMYGLRKLFRFYQFSFQMKPFVELGDLGNDMRFIIRDGNNETKYFIHANDSCSIKENDYLWCDVYGCVNTNFELFPQSEYPKLVSLCPSFGIIPYSIWFAIRMAIVCFFNSFQAICNREEWNQNEKRCVSNAKSNIRHYWSRIYKGVTQRKTYDAYQPRESKNNYIFFLSTLWYSDQWNKNDEGVNQRRANFIRASKMVANGGGAIFEGGFANRSYSQSAEKFKDCMGISVTMDEWMQKTHQSAVVFNTPAFWNCHGWKLGEYLAMGKCIMSTKLSNDLPAPLVHGEQIHYVENTEESMREAIEYILAHPEYRHKLEQGAREYWEQYGTPEVSLRLLGITK